MTTSRPTPGSEAARRKNRRLMLVMALVVVVGLGYFAWTLCFYDPNYQKAVMVYDANQITLKSGRGVELIGVDPPPVQDRQVGAKAAALTTEWVLHRKIRIETDKRVKNPAGWILGYVFCKKDGREIFLNEELVRRGYARAVPEAPNLKYRQRLATAEAEAKAKKLGIWSDDYRLSGS